MSHDGPSVDEDLILPPYRALLAVDTERFSRNPSACLSGLSALVPEVLERAMISCGLEHVWRARRFPQSTGDGYLLGTDPSNMPLLLNPFLDCLQRELERQDKSLRAQGRERRLRLRLSLHIGPVPDRGEELRDRVSTPTNELFRLLDAEPARRALSRSNPDVTFVAAIISQRVFEDVVQAGYSSLDQSLWEPVSAELPHKDFSLPAWLYVPRPSHSVLSPVPDPPTEGGAMGDGQRPGRPTVPGTTPPAAGTVISPVFHGDVASNLMANEITGNISSHFGQTSFGQGPEEDPR